MKFERCEDCGLTYDRHVRGAFCPHCRDFARLYFKGGIVFLIVALSLLALICLL